jgi:signal transduction histidine kinase
VNAATNAVQAVRRARATGLAAGGPGPEPPPVVIATTATSGGGVRVTVRDAGPGIDPALMPRVFEPFVTTRRGGTGLGLAIARNVIEGLGGCIDLASQPGAGTVLTVELPAVPPTGPPAPLAP